MRVNVEDTVMRKDLKDEIDKILSALPLRDARMMRMRFGLEDGRWRTLDEVSEEFGVTRERVRQIEIQTKRRMRKMLCSINLDYFLAVAG